MKKAVFQAASPRDGVYLKGRGTACTRFISVRPQYYPTALVATTERPRTEQWMAPKGRERS